MKCIKLILGNAIYYSQFTCSNILLLTEGGTPLDAMQRYAPISSRVTWVKFKNSPSILKTEKLHKIVRK